MEKLKYYSYGEVYFYSAFGCDDDDVDVDDRKRNEKGSSNVCVCFILRLFFLLRFDNNGMADVYDGKLYECQFTMTLIRCCTSI